MKRLLLLAALLALFVPAMAAERGITLKRDFGTLYGTLLTPDGGAETAALIIAGSGPTDRNGNNPVGMRTDCYRQLAEALQQAGIASLRYDKRAIGSSLYDDPTQVAEVTLEDFIGDAAALCDLLAAEGFRRVVLIGHSEGALIALCAAQQTAHAAAVISVAGPGYPMDRILRIQLANQLAEKHFDKQLEAEAIIAQLKRGEKVDMNAHPEFQMLFNEQVQPFLISTFRYDPRTEIRKLRIPVLIIGGSKDLQVSADNAEALAAAQPAARKIIVEGMTHVLKPNDPAAPMAVYSNPSIPLDPTFAAAVIEWLNSDFR